MEDKLAFDNYKLIADQYFRDNKLEEAIHNYTLAIESNVESDNNYKIYMNRCLSYFKLERFDEALDDAIKATRLNNESSKAWSRVGSCLVALHRYKQAVKAFEKSCELEPTNDFYKNLLENAKDKDIHESDDTDTEEEDEEESEKNMDKDDLKQKIEDLKKSNNFPDLLKDKNGITDGLVDGLFNSMLSNDKLMNKLSDKNFQDKVVDYQKNPFAIFNDKEMMDLMNDIISKTKFDQ